MKFCVLIRQTPDTEATVRASADGTVKLESQLSVPNPPDLSALELALRMKEDGLAREIVAVALGGEALRSALQLALAMGADEAVLIHSDSAGTLPTEAMILGRFVGEVNPSLFIVGHESATDSCAAVAHYLAAVLNWPVVTGVTELKVHEGTALAKRSLERGWREMLEVDLPAVVAVLEAIAEPRYVGRGALARAGRTPVRDWKSDSSLHATEQGSPEVVKYRRPLPASTFVPHSNLPALERLEEIISGGVAQRGGNVFKGEPALVAKDVVDFLEARLGPTGLTPPKEL